MTPTSIQIPSLLVSISMMLGQIYSCITWQIKRNQYVFGKRSDLEKKNLSLSSLHQHHKQVMVVSVYCRVIFYADKREARGKKHLPHYRFCPTFTHWRCNSDFQWSSFRLSSQTEKKVNTA